MKRSDDPNIVSLESARRRRLEESRLNAKRAAKIRPAGPGDKAINWRRVPLALAALAAFAAVGWAISNLGALLGR